MSFLIPLFLFVSLPLSAQQDPVVMTVNGVYQTVGENNLLQLTPCACQHGDAAIVGEVETCHVGSVAEVLSQFFACRHVDAGYWCVPTAEVAQVGTSRDVDGGQVRTSEAVKLIQVLAVRRHQAVEH